MGSRRHLTSVALGTAQSFASRNNDVDGWWAIGLLLGELSEGNQDYRIDLVSGEAAPVLGEGRLGALGPAWAQYLRWSLARHGLSLSQVQRAGLTLEFDLAASVESRFPGGPDRPFRCTVEIEDDRGRLHTGIAEGHSGRLDDFADPTPFQRPMRSAGQHNPVRVLQRLERSRTLIGMNPDREASSASWAAALTLGAAGCALLAYGLFGLAVVTGDWIPCLSPQATASLNSLPGGYCEATNWVRQFGIGLILTTAGVLGIVGAVLLVRRRPGRSPDVQQR